MYCACKNILFNVKDKMFLLKLVFIVLLLDIPFLQQWVPRELAGWRGYRLNLYLYFRYTSLNHLLVSDLERSSFLDDR